MFAVQHLKHFVCPLRLIPIDVAGVMGRFFVVVSRLMAVKDGTPESATLHAVPITAAGDMAPGEDEFKPPLSRFAEQGDGGVLQAFLIGIPRDLLENGGLILGMVELQKDLFDEILLVRGEIFSNPCLGDVPVGADFFSLLVLEGKANLSPLSFAQTLIQ